MTRWRSITLSLFLALASPVIAPVEAASRGELVAAEEDPSSTNAPLKAPLLERTFSDVGKDSARWVASMCETAKRLDTAGYANFIRLVREESDRSRHFATYTAPENASRAFECLQIHADTASPRTQFELYRIIRSSPQRVSADPYRWLKSAALRGDPMAQHAMAEAIVHFGLAAGMRNHDTPAALADEASPERYRFWLTRAAEANVPGAQYSLGRMYVGILGADWARQFIDVPKGIAWLERAANQSTDEHHRNLAAGRLGELYFSGEKVQQDYQKALDWLLRVDETRMRSCDPLVYVRQLLVRIYTEGLGVARNPEKVRHYTSTPTACR